MGGDTTITGGQNLAQTQAAQASGQKKTTAPAEPMPIMSMTEDQNTTKTKPAGGKVPHLADLKPSGKFVMNDLNHVGGIPGVLKMLVVYRQSSGSRPTLQRRSW